jgi:hypothetical protein
MTDKEKAHIVAQKARDTFLRIKELKRVSPKHTAVQREEMKVKEREMQDQWWEEVKNHFVVKKEE